MSMTPYGEGPPGAGDGGLVPQPTGGGEILGVIGDISHDARTIHVPGRSFSITDSMCCSSRW